MDGPCRSNWFVMSRGLNQVDDLLVKIDFSRADSRGRGSGNLKNVRYQELARHRNLCCGKGAVDIVSTYPVYAGIREKKPFGHGIIMLKNELAVDVARTGTMG